MTCRGCLNSPSVCPCQPVACPLLPKTFRSAGTSTERNVSATSQHAGQTRCTSGHSDCMHPATREVLDRRVQQAGAVRPDSGQKQRSYDIGCGFVQFCHKHIFANPAAVSPVSRSTRKMSHMSGTAASSQSHCDSFNAHFNPCYSNSSPPDDDDDDDINLDAVSLCDRLCSSRGRKGRELPAVSEMSESCFEGLQSSTHERIIDLPRRFRPLSWAGPDDDCLTDAGCSCSGHSVVSALKPEACYLPEAQLLNLNSVSQTASDDLRMPLSTESPFYWELELPGTASGINLISQTSPVPEMCQKLASPLRMGTLAFDAGSMSRSGDAYAAATAKLLQTEPLCQNSASVADTAKAPKMGCLPARCFICRDCHQHVCSPSGSNKHNPAVSSKTSLPRIPRACKCLKHQRCPTPPRMLSPCVSDDDSVRVPVADI